MPQKIQFFSPLTASLFCLPPSNRQADLQQNIRSWVQDKYLGSAEVNHSLPPVTDLCPPYLAEQSISVSVEVSDASVVSVSRELVVHFCRLSRYALALRLIVGM